MIHVIQSLLSMATIGIYTIGSRELESPTNIASKWQVRLCATMFLVSLGAILVFRFGMKMVTVAEDRDDCDRILDCIERRGFSTHLYKTGSRFRPSGIVLGWDYFGYVTHGGNGDESSSCNISLISTRSVVSAMLKDVQATDPPSDVDQAERGHIQLYERRGPFQWLGYYPRDIDCSRFVPEPEQARIIADVCEFHRSKAYGGTVVYLAGGPGSGKTTLATLLAVELNGSICMTFNPTDPGDTLDALIREVRPSKDRPMVVLLDEADGLITNVHKNAIAPHKSIPIAVRDKAGLNRMLDYVDRFAQNVIFVMASNVSREAIDRLDPSYLRDKRVHLVCTLTMTKGV